MFERMKKWIVPKKEQPKKEQHTHVAHVMQGRAWMKHAEFPKTYRYDTYFSQPTSETMGRIQTRQQAGSKRINELQKEWMADPTALPFVDWLYIKHNIFAYVPNDDLMWENLNRYNNTNKSSPTSKNYVHFVQWLKDNNVSFYDINSGRTVDEIIQAYESETSKQKAVVEEEPQYESERDKMPLVCDIKPRFTFDRMSLADLDKRIAELEERMERDGMSPTIQQQIAMAVKYRHRLAEEGQ